MDVQNVENGNCKKQQLKLKCKIHKTIVYNYLKQYLNIILNTFVNICFDIEFKKEFFI